MNLRHATWRKASYSHAEGKCVEVTTWRKASYSTGDNNCVEVSSLPGTVAVRDSKDCTGPALAFTPAQWQVFTARLRPGHGA